MMAMSLRPMQLTIEANDGNELEADEIDDQGQWQQ